MFSRKGQENQLLLESEVEVMGELSRVLSEDLTSSFGIATRSHVPLEKLFYFSMSISSSPTWA